MDEPIYRRLPAFLIATVDKFAGLPWLGGERRLLRPCDRFDRTTGASTVPPTRNGTRLDSGAQPRATRPHHPGRTAPDRRAARHRCGLYEAALDRLATRDMAGARVRPKIVATTATVRRAAQQIQALFDRRDTQVFAPPGVDETNSFFAHTVPSGGGQRILLGVAAQGRGPKLVFLRVLQTVLAGAQAAYGRSGGRKSQPG